MSRFLPALAVAAGAAVASCDSGTEPPERIVTSVTCDPMQQPDAFNCAIKLEQSESLRMELETFTCAAHGNTLHLLQPVDRILTTDACYTPSGTGWTIDGPFDAGTVVELEFVSARLEFDPGVRITGEYPEWVVYFEDGGDDDFDDLILTITAGSSS